MLTDTGYVSPLTIVSNGNYTGNPWNNPDNLLGFSAFASTPPTSGLGSDVLVGNFIFGTPIPQGSVITGIEIQYTGYRGPSADPATALQVYAYDNTNSNNFFYELTPVFANFTTTPTKYLFGSPNFLFNTTWSVDQINNIKIRLQANGELSVQGVQIRVTYQPAFVGPVHPTDMACASIFQSQPMQLIAPVSANGGDVTWLVNKFTTSDGVDITNADVGNGIPITADQGNPNEENDYVTNIASTAGNQVLLTVTRGWSFRDPNSQTAPLRQHGAGAEIIIGNSIQFYDIFLRKCQIGTLVSAPIEALYQSDEVTPYIRSINVTGAGATFTGTPFSGSGGGDDMTLNIPGFGVIQPVINNFASFSSGGVQVNTFTQVFTVTGTDRDLLVGVTLQETQTITAMTWNGVPVVFQHSNNASGVRVEVFNLIAPDLGTHSLVITFSGPTYIAGGMISFTQVDQTLGYTFSTINSGDTDVSSGSATTATSNAIVVHVAGTMEVGINYTPGGGESLITSSVLGAFQNGIELQLVGTPATVSTFINLSILTHWSNVIGYLNGIQPVTPVPGLLSINGDTTPAQLFIGGSGVSIVDNGVGGHTISATGGSGTVTQINTGTGLTGGPITATGTISLSDTAVTPGAYTNANITVDQQGRITLASSGVGAGGKLFLQTTTFTTPTDTAEHTIASFTVPGGTLGTNNAINLFIKSIALLAGNYGSTFRIKYGGSTLASLQLFASTGGTTPGSINAILSGDGATNVQRLDMDSTFNIGGMPSPSNDTEFDASTGAGAIDSTVNQTLSITIQNGVGTSATVGTVLAQLIS